MAHFTVAEVLWHRGVTAWEGGSPHLFSCFRIITMKEIPLTRGYVAFVDAADFDRVVAAGPWHAVNDHHKNVYARHSTPHNAKGKQQSVSMHRFILGVTDPKTKVDHRNRYGLDNRRENLRLPTDSQNGANAGKCHHEASVVRQAD
jgi:hypothetical protein